MQFSEICIILKGMNSVSVIDWQMYVKISKMAKRYSAQKPSMVDA